MAGRRTRRNTAASAQSTVRSDHPEQGMIVPVNGLETALNNVANMIANIMERLDKALPGPSRTREVPAGQPRQVLRTASSPILQELHDPEEVERERWAIARRRAEELARNSRANGDRARAVSQVVGNGNENPRGTVFERILHQRAHRQRIGRGGSQAPMRSVVVLDEDEVQSQVRVPAPQRLGPQVLEAGKFQDLRQQIQEMQRKINMGRVFTTRTNTPLAPEIFAEHYPQGFKMPFVKRYDGESDPQEHINSYVQVMIAVDASDALMCRCFLQTMDSKVVDWVNHIPAGSIRTWDELGLRFLEHFAGNCRPKKHFTHLLASVRQKHGESLKNFLIRWRKESREIEGTDDKSRLAMFTTALPDGLLHTDLTTHPPDTFEEAMVRAGRYKVCNVEDTGKWCSYHRKNDHYTKDCYTLKNEMARLIRRGHLKRFVQDGDAGNPGNAQNGKRRDKEVAQAETREKRHIRLEDEEEDSEPAPHRQKKHHECNFIIGGNTGGNSATSQKKWANAQGAGSRRDELSHYKTPLTGFTSDSIEPEGVITLPVEIGDTKATRKLDMEFVVVGIISNTNIILGRPRLEDLECVISPRHLCIKFPTPHGVGIARGSQRVSRAWYLKATKQPINYDTQVGEVTAQLLRAEEKCPRVEVAGDIEEVELEPGTPGRLVRIGKGLGTELRSRVISVLRRFRKVFAWSPADMAGLDHKIAVHHLNVLRGAKPVKQKRRHLSQERRDL
ncbi:unnamed protein product [Cuscuta campestris]|uniref:Retrotransposon gag domain-containing protein n=1 Tax=Cuscuta campestris TaxID=132261 RepID=A0A484KUR7_9ASTE|nr:unnamed protein product [Cuscuta campestris]